MRGRMSQHFRVGIILEQQELTARGILQVSRKLSEIPRWAWGSLFNRCVSTVYLEIKYQKDLPPGLCYTGNHMACV
jgi:hypothetical protein